MGHPGSLPVRVNLSEAEIFCTPKQVCGHAVLHGAALMLCTMSVPVLSLCGAVWGMLLCKWGVMQLSGLEVVLRKAALNPFS